MYKHITVSGNDAVEFLQGQLTQDVSLLESAGDLFAAWCNPKGRVICTLTLVQNTDSIGLVIPATIVEAVLKRLTMYRLRSAVAFDVDEMASESVSAAADPLALIQAGIPTIDASNSEKFTPHMLNLDKLGAISFTKGCYTGQEIVARTENLGKSKRRMRHYKANAEGVAVGDDLSLDERHIGKVVNVFERDVLAVTPVASDSHSLTFGDTSLELVELPYSL